MENVFQFRGIFLFQRRYEEEWLQSIELKCCRSYYFHTLTTPSLLDDISKWLILVMPVMQSLCAGDTCCWSHIICCCCCCEWGLRISIGNSWITWMPSINFDEYFTPLLLFFPLSLIKFERSGTVKSQKRIFISVPHVMIEESFPVLMTSISNTEWGDACHNIDMQIRN